MSIAIAAVRQEETSTLDNVLTSEDELTSSSMASFQDILESERVFLPSANDGELDVGEIFLDGDLVEVNAEVSDLKSLSTAEGDCPSLGSTAGNFELSQALEGMREEELQENIYTSEYSIDWRSASLPVLHDIGASILGGGINSSRMVVAYDRSQLTAVALPNKVELGLDLSQDSREKAGFPLSGQFTKPVSEHVENGEIVASTIRGPVSPGVIQGAETLPQAGMSLAAAMRTPNTHRGSLEPFDALEMESLNGEQLPSVLAPSRQLSQFTTSPDGKRVQFEQSTSNASLTPGRLKKPHELMSKIIIRGSENEESRQGCSNILQPKSSGPFFVSANLVYQINHNDPGVWVRATGTQATMASNYLNVGGLEAFRLQGDERGAPLGVRHLNNEGQLHCPAQFIENGMTNVAKSLSSHILRSGEAIRQIANQVALIFHSSPAGNGEFSLRSEELGSVVVRIVEQVGTFHITVVIERTETLEFFRKHTEMLMRELQSEGIQSVELDFQDDRRGGDPHSNAEAEPDLNEVSDLPMERGGSFASLTPASRLDLRV